MNECNWAGNHVYSAYSVHRPRSVEQLCELVAGASRIRALGTRHCFNDIGDSEGDLVELSGMDPPIEIGDGWVTFGGGTRYGDLAPRLDAAGYALANLASLPHISVAGSVATATHGSGNAQPSLAAAVTGVELVTGDGRLRHFSRGRDPEFPGVVVALGALGVVTRLTLELVPAFQVRQDVFEHLPLATVIEHFAEITGVAHSVSMFTDWTRDTVDMVWLKSRVDAYQERGDLFGALPADGRRHPAHAAGVSAENCTEQGGVPGAWHHRLPHFALGFTPSTGAELQSEYLIPRRHAGAAFEVLRGLGERLAPVLLVSEIRTVAADDLWLSPFHRQDCVAVHLTWLPREAEVTALLPLIEERLAPYEARPHWGKLFHRVSAGFPKLPEFRALAGSLDPDGKFRNAFLRRHLFGG